MSPPKHDKHALLAFLALPQVSNEAGEISAVQPPQPIGGPGDLVKIILDKLGIEPNRNCGCEAMRRQMNEWGYRGCWTNRAKLTEWFQARAAEAGIRLSTATVTKLVGAAIRNTLRDRAS